MYVLCCSVGWTAFDVGDTCRECVESGLDFGELGAAEVSETTAVIHEAMAVFDQFISCDLVNRFHLRIQACSSVSDEDNGGRNLLVQVAEGSIRRRDALICRPDVLI